MIKTVTVIGAGGTMGCNISAIFASFGNAKVYMLDIEKPINAVERAIKSVRSESIRKKLIPVDFSSFKECIEDSDLVFESVIENIDVKKDIANKCAVFLKKSAFLCTGTSGLSINEIAQSLPEIVQDRYYGVHFFNPPYSLILCELIKNNYSKENDLLFLRDYLETVLRRSVVICRDKPAFIGNRIGFQFINAALQLANKYSDRGGIDYVDSIFGPFTGRLMAPCNTADFVGLDVHKAIMDNLSSNVNDYEKESFILPNFLLELIEDKKLGRKSGEGLYKIQINEDGTKIPLVYDIKSKKYRPKKKYIFAFAEKMKSYFKNGDYDLAFEVLKNDCSEEAQICRDLLIRYVNYSLFVGKQVCDDIACSDDAMANGFGWCPPLALSNILLGTDYVTKYDYRSFFKAVK